MRDAVQQAGKKQIFQAEACHKRSFASLCLCVFVLALNLLELKAYLPTKNVAMPGM